MSHTIRTTFDVLSVTSILVLLVLGMGVIVSMMGVFNLAHGELVLLGAVAVYVAAEAGLPVWVGMLAAPLVLAVVGLGLERTVIRPFYGRPLVALLATWALATIIREGVSQAIGSQSQTVRPPLTGTVAIGGADVSQWRLLIILVTPVVLALSVLFLRRTNAGLMIRATLDNPALARATGVPTKRIYAGTFAFGAALAGLAGALIVPLQSLYPALGDDFLMQSFLAVMIGGIGSFEAPLVGAVVVGLSVGFAPTVVSPVAATSVVFAVAIVLMRLRPGGLFGSIGSLGSKG
jgi:branched-chain amino acid transport system permease protein